MKKKLIGSLCLLAILLGVAIAPNRVDAADGKYEVGYAIKDMNPWADPENPDVNQMVNIKLTGNGNDDLRECTGLMDDNGDGKVDTNDGLFVTCVSVTDDWGNTVMYITMDTLQGYPAAITDVRAAVVEALGSDVISADQIMISGTHTHSGPNLYNISAASASAEWKAYYDYIIRQTAAAAVEAYNDRAPATMKRGSIDATASTAKRYNSGKGYKMNFIRHYDVTSTASFLGMTLGTKYHVAGSNFGGSVTAGANSAFGKHSSLATYKVKTSTHAVDADNDMHLLTFEFADKAPIVMVNWRAHPTTNSSTGGSYMTKASSDYVNSLRYYLGQEGYRTAFIQGAGGNTVIRSSVETDWKALWTDKTSSETNTYGRLLSEIALDCIENNMTDTLAAGEIRTVQLTFTGDIQKDDAALVTAAKAVQEYYTANGKYPTFPYKHANGAIINSNFHANQIITRSTASSGAYNSEELDIVALGDSALFVTAPNELSDRYDLNGSTKDADNDWLKLVNNETYGTPFVISHANGSFGYMPNYLNYTYNTAEYTTLTGKPSNGSEAVGAGSYEANTSRFAPGTGEKLIDVYQIMIGILGGENTRKATCPACKQEVQWLPLYSFNTGSKSMASGHYYLEEDISGIPQNVVEADQKICLDLNGHSMRFAGRAFITKSADTANNIPAATNAVVSILDSAGGGSITGTAADNNPGGGAFSIGANNTVNLYGGTLRFENSKDTSFGGTGVGGVMSMSGTLNMYGGTIEGADVYKSTYNFTNNGCGGAIYLYSTGKVNVYGGTITSGSVPEGVENGGMGPCIYLSSSTSKVTLSGDGCVEDIYHKYRNGSNVTISGSYTGSAGLSYHSDISLSQNLDVGNATAGSDIFGATLTCSDAAWVFRIDGTNLRLVSKPENPVAAIGNSEYATLQEAVDQANGHMIQMLRNETKAVTVNEGKDVYLDLCGCSITGKVTVQGSYTLYCKDSKTDDYTVADNDYGRMTSVSGNVKGIPEESTMADDGYLMISEVDGVSFHRVGLDLTAMTLRAVIHETCAPGVYYKSDFKGDEKVAERVIQYGVALSVQAMPDETNLNAHCGYSGYTAFAPGDTGNAENGILLKGVMKPTNKEAANRRNANMGVFGRAYILTEEGYLFGAGCERTLQQQTEDIDGLWDTLTQEQKEGILTMYETYRSIMEDWELPNLAAAKAA